MNHVYLRLPFACAAAAAAVPARTVRACVILTLVDTNATLLTRLAPWYNDGYWAGGTNKTSERGKRTYLLLYTSRYSIFTILLYYKTTRNKGVLKVGYAGVIDASSLQFILDLLY